MGKPRHKISYIRKPFAKRSLIGLPLALVSLILCGVSISLSVGQQGRGGLDVAAWGISSLLFAVVALAYGGLSLMERDKNYLLAKIGIWMSGVLVVFWICIVVAGLAGKPDASGQAAGHPVRYSAYCHAQGDACCFQEREMA